MRFIFIFFKKVFVNVEKRFGKRVDKSIKIFIFAKTEFT